MNSGIVFDIKRFAIHDGPGIRTTIFLKGCALDCWWCHNPESRSRNIEKQSDVPLRKCPDLFPYDYSYLGKDVYVKEVIDIVLKDRIYYDESGGGVTFSGGEPFISPGFLLQLLKEAKRHGLHTTVDTTGYTGKENIHSALDYIDLFLFDIKFINDEKHKKYTGVSNRIILGNLNLLKESKANTVIRIPLIPDITDTEENLLEIINYLKVNNFNFPVECLPYNPIGESKYDRMGIELRSGKKVRQSETLLNNIKQIFTDHGFKVLQE